jgi:hypothetical protein
MTTAADDVVRRGQRIEMWACEDCGHVEFFMPLGKSRKKSSGNG